jgi:molybdenum cofactor synthesis domain-containing protein
MLTKIPVQKSVGMVLPHDLTRIVPGESKGRAFKRGHIIQHEDIETLLLMGKEHIYAFELAGGLTHEDDAARELASCAAGPGIRLSGPCEGRVNLIARHSGLLSIDVDRLMELNLVQDIVFATLHTNQFVTKGRSVGGVRVVPLVVEDSVIQRAEGICSGEPLIQVKPLVKAKVGVVTTGSEVFHGRIQDGFGPVIKRKFKELGSEIVNQVFVSDDTAMTVSAIQDFVSQGADMVVCTGGMSVDPDDQTPASIRAAGAEVIAYGAPTFPGAMFLLASIGRVPILGLPGCVMYHRASIFDLIVPRILAGETVTREDIVRLGHGGFCVGCEPCRYPACSFGKGA